METPARPFRSPGAAPWDLAAEAIAVKIRWFGLVIGFILANVHSPGVSRLPLNAILALGAGYTLLDTVFSLRGKVFLGRYPLVISAMEALFIGLLCYFDTGLDSPFRYYYFLSLVCCAVRHSSPVTYVTCALHCLSYAILYLTLPDEQRVVPSLLLMPVMLGWVTWAVNALAMLLRGSGEYLAELNQALTRQQADLELRIAERTAQLQESQAHVLHQEKMAAFGLLAAGIAHEVGNPLTSISSMVQILQRHQADEYTQTKLGLVSGQLKRIQSILRELIEFSRPASLERARVSLPDILEEALNIAKYYKRTPGRIAFPELPADLPLLWGVRNQLVQVFLNLILNAIDAVEKDGQILLTVRKVPGAVEVDISDNGCGIRQQDAPRLFQPYFTTKKTGTGLGLFVTRQLIASHGGSVSFEPRSEGGSTFRVRLPLPGGLSPAETLPLADSPRAESELAPW